MPIEESPAPSPTPTPVQSVQSTVTRDPGTPSVTLSDGETLAQLLLTAEERQQAALGTSAAIGLDVRDVSGQLPQAERDQVELATRSLSGYSEVFQYLDITLSKTVGGIQTMLTDPLPGRLRLTFSVPLELQGATERTFAVVRIHNGGAAVLTDLDSDPATVTVSTDRFSLYALVYTQPIAPATATPEPTPTPTPEPTPTPTPEPTPTATPEPTPTATPEPTAAPTATPAPTAPVTAVPTSAPTGDDTPGPGAYLVLLAGCVAALAAVCLIAGKRRKN